MLEINEANVAAWSQMGARGTFGKAIVDLGENLPDLVVVTADLTGPTRVTEFCSKFPSRFFQVGVAEQNMVGVSAGLALAGKIAFATTFASFASMRCCEQVRTDVAYPNLNVKVVGARAGVGMGPLGASHHAIEDIAIMRAIPNMVILSPADGAEIVKCVWAAALHEGPVYLRLTGEDHLDVVHDGEYEFEIGRSVLLRQGTDVAIIATGAVVAQAVGAADILEGRGIAARVIDVHTIKPIDADAIRKAAGETRLVVTVEEHNVIGGLGSAVAEVMAADGGGPRLVRLGLPDEFGHVACYAGFLSRCGLTAAHIADTVTRGLV